MKIALVGWYGNKNTGDEAIKCVLEDFFSEFEIQTFNLQFMNDEMIKKFQEMDYIILGGGGVFNYGSPPPFYNASEWLNKIKAQVLILSVGVTCPIYGYYEQNNLKFLLERSTKVSVRDYISEFEFERILPSKRIDILPDPAILLKEKPFEFEKREGPYAGISFRKKWWKDAEYAARKIAETLDKAYQNTGLRFVFIPFSIQEGIDDDRVMHKMIISNLKHDCYINIENELSPHEIKNLLSKMDLVIGMRLHSLIFAASSGVPVIGINYFTKIRRFMESIEQENCIVELSEIDTECLYEKIDNAMRNKQEISRNLANKIKYMKNILSEYLSEIKQEIHSGKILTPNVVSASIDGTELIEKYEKIILKDPYHIGAYIQLGIEYEKNNEVRKAIEMYLKAVRLEENNLIIHYLLSRLYYRLGDLSNANKEGEKVIELGGIHYMLNIEYEEGNRLVWKNQEFTAVLQTKDSEIKTLQNINLEYQQTLISIHQSLTWRTVRKFDSLVELFLPNGTKRRQFYDSIFLKFRSITSIEHIPENKLNPYSGENENQIIPPKNENKIDIICFPIIDWSFRFQRPQQLLSKFANNGHRIFYLTVDLIPLNEKFEVKTLAKNVFELKLNISKKFNIYKDILTEIQLKSLIESIDLAKNSLNIEAMSLVAFPSWGPVVFKLKEVYGWNIIYDCMDEHSGFSNINTERIQEEEKLLKESDLLIVTSLYLNKKAQKYRSNNIVLIPNAGDFDHFNKLMPNNLLRDIKKPIIGYYGAIAEWFDDEIIENIANKRKDWNLVFIGSTFGSKINKLEKLSNVHFLGEQPYSELPKYLYWFDVCIIPFKITPLIEATHPVKFYEFLSSGKPVVTTKLPELLPYGDLCYIAENNEDFFRKVEIALSENDMTLKQKRINFAKINTWDNRYMILSEHFSKK